MGTEKRYVYGSTELTNTHCLSFFAGMVLSCLKNQILKCRTLLIVEKYTLRSQILICKGNSIIMIIIY